MAGDSGPGSAIVEDRAGLLADTWVILPVHNRRDITLACLGELRSGQAWAQLNVVVIDDGSTDGTGEGIRERFPSVHVLEGDGSLWWGGGIRRGLAYAMDRDAEVFVWLNDDVYPDPGSVERLAARVAEGPERVLSGMVRPDEPLPYHSTVDGERQGYTTRWRKTRTRVVPTVYEPTLEVQPCDALSGRFVGIHREVVEAIGLPDDETFPQNYCDHDYTYRATEHGFGVGVYTPATAWDTDASPYHSRISAERAFLPVLKDALFASRYTGRSFLDQYRLDRRFVDGSPLLVALVVVFHAAKICAALGIKLVLTLLSGRHRFRAPAD
jgi:GT2 family glycosyltransferase